MSKIYLNYDEILDCVQIMKNDFAENVQEIIRKANQSMKNLFMIPHTMAADRWVDLGNPIDWLYNPTDDPEFTWLLNRHWHMLMLGKAYLFTGNEAYAEAFKTHFLSWIAQCPVPVDIPYDDAVFFQKKGPWRLLEVGLRIQSWIWAYTFLQKSKTLDDGFLNIFWEAISEHADYLCHYLGETEINHATMHMQGLFMASVAYDSHPRAPYWRQVSTERLELCLLHQIDDDGLQTELSTHYHNASIEFFGTPYVLAKKAGFPFSDWYKNKLRSIAAYTEASIRPDGISSPISDSNWSNDAPHLLGFVGLALDDEYYLKMGNFNEEMLWMFGADAYHKYSKPTAEKTLNNHSFIFPASGYYILKNEQHYLFFDAAKMGGAHGHADILSFEWMFRNQLIFSDLGYYTYEEGFMREYFKSTRNHNTITIDDQDQTPYISSQKWGFPIAKPKLHRHIDHDEYFFIDASHDGYMRLKDPAVHRRWLLLLKQENILVVLDWLKGEHIHQIRQHFNLSEDATVQINGHTAEVNYPSTSMKMAMQWWTTGENEELHITEETGWISKEYAFKDKIPVINANMSFMNQMCLATICIPSIQSDTEDITIESMRINDKTTSVSFTIAKDQNQKQILVTDNSIQYKMQE